MTAEETPDYLDAESGNEFPSPPVETAIQLLPFHGLIWQNFERLCYRLARSESEFDHARLFGVAGQDQSGIDLYYRDSQGYSVVQCRQVAALTATGLASAVDGFLSGDWVHRAHRFVFCTSHRAVRTELADEIEVQTARLGALDPPIEFEVWDAEELSAKLKEQPKLVSDFFGPAWLEAFLPQEAASQVAAQLTDISSGITRFEQNWMRIVVLDWAPAVLRDALAELARDDPKTFGRLDDDIGNPPDSARVVAAVTNPPRWLIEANVLVWRILAMVAEKSGEWEAARLSWLAAAERSEDDARAGFTVAAAVAADIAGDAAGSEELLERAASLAPSHPRVLLQRLDQRLWGAERLAALEGIESDEPGVAALIAVHRAVANMLVPNMEEAQRYVEEAQQLMPESLIVKATAINAVIQRGRLNTNEHRSIDYSAVLGAYEEAVQIRAGLLDKRRYEESLRVLMLTADALTVLREFERSRGVIRTATDEELATTDAAEILGDAALRAFGWQEALSLTENAAETDGIKRIRASAHLESGGLTEQNRALATLDQLIADRGPEAPQAAIFRLAATLGDRRAGWSEDAASALREEGFDFAALAVQALYLTFRERDYSAAQSLLTPHQGEPWAEVARLRIAVMRDDTQAMQSSATALLARGPAQDDRVECARALAMSGELTRAREVLAFTARDPATPPAVRADAYSSLVPLIAEELNDWDEAAALHAEWVELRPADVRASAWAPRIANRLRTDRRS